VQLQQLLETPLLNEEGRQWKNEDRKPPAEYESWINAEVCSAVAADQHNSFKENVFPLQRTKNASELDSMWKHINAVGIHCYQVWITTHVFIQ